MINAQSQKPDVLIAFLGAPKQYDEVTYTWKNQNYITPYCPDALVHFLQPSRLVLLVTESASHAKSGGQNNLEALTTRVEAQGCEVSAISIRDSPFPEAEFANVLWDMFNTVVKQIRPRESVAFDITFGYRFLPILTVLVGQFLHYTNDVVTTGIYYGAREAENENGFTPIVDLSALAKVMAWTHAAAHFEKTGNAVPLIEQKDAVEGEDLGNVWQQLDQTSRSLRMGMATQVGQSVSALLQTVSTLPATSQPAAAPLHILLNRVAEKYQKLSISEPLTIQHANKHLNQQADLIEWYVENQLFLQAILLAREWLVTWVMVGNRFGDLLDWENRNAIARQLGEAALANKRSPLPEESSKAANARDKLKHVSGIDDVIQRWSDSTRIRNQMAHMSMDFRQRPMAEIQKMLHGVAQTIRQLANTLPPSQAES